MSFRILIIAISLLGLFGMPAWATPKPDQAQADHEVRALTVQGFDRALIGEHTDFRTYTAVFVNNPLLEFDARWLREHRHDLSQRDQRRIRKDHTAALREALNESLSKEGLQLAKQPGPGILVVNPRLADFRLTAPDYSRGPMTRQYVDYVGSARLELALQDGADQRLLGSLSTFSQTRSHGALNDLKETNRVVNLRDFRMLYQKWSDRFARFMAEQSR